MKRIAIEGGEGAGKSTLIKQMKNASEFEQFEFVQEPGTTPKALKLRDWIFTHPEATQYEIAKAYADARASVNQEVVLKTLPYKNVIFDRSIISGIVYQTQSNELTKDDIIKINQESDPEFTLPDIIIFIRIDPEYARSRILKNKRETNYMDFMTLKTMEKIQNDFINLIQNLNRPYMIYDARDIENGKVTLNTIEKDINSML